MSAPTPTQKSERWGSRLPFRGELAARLLCNVSNVTLPQKQRETDAVELGLLVNLAPHWAWRLACDAAIALGFGPNGRAAWRQIVNHEPPHGEWPTAEQWLQAANLDTEGHARDYQPGVSWPPEDWTEHA